MVKFNTHFDTPFPVEVTTFDKHDTVERAGYVPLKNQIRAFRESGVLLRATRALQYHSPDDGSKALDTIKEELFKFGGVDYSDMSELAARSNALREALSIRDSQLNTGAPADEKSSASNATNNLNNDAKEA